MERLLYPTEINSCAFWRFKTTLEIGQHSQCLIVASHTPNWNLTLACPVSSVSQPVKLRQTTKGLVTFLPFGPVMEKLQCSCV